MMPGCHSDEVTEGLAASVIGNRTWSDTDLVEGVERWQGRWVGGEE